MSFLISCSQTEREKLISEFNKREDYKIVTTEKSLTKKDSVYSVKSYSKSYDSKNRLINIDNFQFYFYNEKEDRLDSVKSIHSRLSYTDIYEYHKNGLLKNIIRKNNHIKDTIKTFSYDLKKNQTESKSNFQNISQEYENDQLKTKTVYKKSTNPKTSNFQYDSLNRLIVENWVFGENHKMKTRFEYYENGKLFRKIDSTYNQSTNPKEFIEFMTEYKYDKNDSIIEIIKLGRVLSESDFKVRGRKIYERIKK